MRTLFVLLLLLKANVLSDITGEKNISPVSCHNDGIEDLLEPKYIGISDPSLDTIAALEQAVQRALAFYALSQNMELSSVYEYYYIDDNVDMFSNNKKSHWIADFQSQIENYSYEIDKKIRTKYNEVIVLIRIIDDPVADNKLTTMGSFMYHYDFLNNKTEYGEKQMFEISCPQMIETLDWNSIIDRTVTRKETSVNEVTYRLKNVANVYDDYGTVDDAMVFSENHYGLWNSYMDTFFQALSNFESNNIVIKNTARQITKENNESYGDKSQDIIRRVMKTEVSCHLITLSMKNNKLYAKWVINEK